MFPLADSVQLRVSTVRGIERGSILLSQIKSFVGKMVWERGGHNECYLVVVFSEGFVDEVHTCGEMTVVGDVTFAIRFVGNCEDEIGHRR